MCIMLINDINYKALHKYKKFIDCYLMKQSERAIVFK